MVEAVSVGKVEPGILRPVEVGEPPRSRLAVREAGTELVLALRCLDGRAYPELEREPREPPELVVRPQDEHVDPRDHPGHRLLRDPGKGLPAEIVEEEVGPVAEVEELEVVLQDAVEALEQAVVRHEQCDGSSPTRDPR